ncbi:MFS transporter [Catenibacillus scindens]|uniref:MFS transporter n=1 Tax=Catenibacillus scindens TaxID=673271 RepID=UPI0032084A76
MMKNTDILWNRSYILISLANFFSWLSYNMITPVMTGYMELLGASVTICGIVGGLFAFTSLLSRPFSGIMSDTFNRKWLMAGFTVVMTISLLIYALVPSIPVILIFRGLHGVAFGISSTASLVLVSECVSEYRMGEAISYYGVMSVASMAVGPSLGIMISDRWGHQACMLVGTGILAIAAVATLLFPYERPVSVAGNIKGDGNAKTAGADKAAGGFLKEGGIETLVGKIVAPKICDLSLINATFTMMNGVVSTFLVVYAAQKAIEGVSWHFTVNAVIVILSRVFLAKKMNLWTLRQNLFPAFISGILALILIGRAEGLIILLVAGVLKAIAQGMSQPALQTEAFRSMPYEKRGIASSTMYIGGDLGQAVGPVIGGVLAEWTGYGVMFMLCAIPIAAAMIYFIFSKRNCKKVKG